MSKQVRHFGTVVGVCALTVAAAGTTLASGTTEPGGTETTIAETTIAGTTVAETTDAGPPPSLPDSIRIGVGIDAAYAPFFVAESEGLFTDEGLENVELVQFARGGEAVDALGAGQVDLAGNSDTTTLTLMAANPVFRALMIYQESGEYLKVVAGADITDPSQIQTMGVVPGLSEYNTDLYVAAEGLEDVEYVEAAPAEIPALMDRGDIDAYILWEPWPAQGVELGGHILGTTGDFGSSYVHWLVATDSWLAVGDHRGYAAAVTRALATASELIEADPELAAEITEEAASVPPEQTIEAVEQIDFAVRGFDDDDFASYERQIEYLMERGMVEQAPELESVIDVEFYDSATG